jgi:hypothetical protein
MTDCGALVPIEMPPDEWEAFADPMDPEEYPDDPDDWESEADE